MRVSGAPYNVFLPPGSYILTIVDNCGNTDHVITVRESEVVTIETGMKPLDGIICTHKIDIESIRSAFLGEIFFEDPQLIEKYALKKNFLLGFDREDQLKIYSNDELHQLRVNHVSEVRTLANKLRALLTNDLQQSVHNWITRRDEIRALIDKKRRAGDNSIEDLACKKRGLKPVTPAYEKCYGHLAELRQKREEQSRLLAEREANNPFADAKKRCTSIGLKPKTEAFGKCVLELTR